MTQFGRALRERNIEILYANTPKAKGRVERTYKTLQDRPVKELRLGLVTPAAQRQAARQSAVNPHVLKRCF